MTSKYRLISPKRAMMISTRRLSSWPARSCGRTERKRHVESIMPAAIVHSFPASGGGSHRESRACAAVAQLLAASVGRRTRRHSGGTNCTWHACDVRVTASCFAQDDLEPSVVYYKWLKKAWAKYGKMKEIFGISLQRQVRLPFFPSVRSSFANFVCRLYACGNAGVSLWIRSLRSLQGRETNLDWLW